MIVRRCSQRSSSNTIASTTNYSDGSSDRNLKEGGDSAFATDLSFIINITQHFSNTIRGLTARLALSVTSKKRHVSPAATSPPSPTTADPQPLTSEEEPAYLE
ncbi:hypothetical protein E2C01_003366 [Portunus trituberculatus]|uniref:Uncharacterized protein n=1 Tax=Portunus trituberculatus TaxID=210409 RepID=A0A5B7CQV9_PORTR|nr:hypothetical protein [Portunus trituberculatus]